MVLILTQGNLAIKNVIKNHGLGHYGAEPIILRYHFGNFVH